MPTPMCPGLVCSAFSPPLGHQPLLAISSQLSSQPAAPANSPNREFIRIRKVHVNKALLLVTPGPLPSAKSNPSFCSTPFAPSNFTVQSPPLWPLVRKNSRPPPPRRSDPPPQLAPLFQVPVVRSPKTTTSAPHNHVPNPSSCSNPFPPNRTPVLKSPKSPPNFPDRTKKTVSFLDPPVILFLFRFSTPTIEVASSLRPFQKIKTSSYRSR